MELVVLASDCGVILRYREAITAVILRCELLRASKDGRTHCAEHHPSRRGEDAAPQDDGRDSCAGSSAEDWARGATAYSSAPLADKLHKTTLVLLFENCKVA
jgi:hypothetical protein